MARNLRAPRRRDSTSMTRTGVTAQCPESISAFAKQICNTHDKDEKKKIEELKAEFEPLTKLMKEVLGIKWICVFKRCGWSQPALILLCRCCRYLIMLK